MANFPPTVYLDLTLADLYNREFNDPNDEIVLVATYPSTRKTLFQRYVYHDEDETTGEQQLGSNVEGVEELSTKAHQVLGTQKFSFSAGEMPFIAFIPEGMSEEGKSDFVKGVQENLAHLHIRQRPKFKFVTDVSQIRQANPMSKLAMRLPIDGLENIDHVLHPDIHYEVLSKRGLATAWGSVNTPACELVDLRTFINLNRWQMGDIEESMKEATDEWEKRVVEVASTKPLPFVAKLQLSLFGKGTYIIKTEEDREAYLEVLPGMIEFNKSRTTSFNIDLYPSTFIFMDFVKCDPSMTSSFAITFFVKKTGQGMFLGCCDQNFVGSGVIWEGASITYSKQSEYHKMFQSTIQDVSRSLHLRGYYGCVGIDVMIDTNGVQWVVDLNVRPPGSLPLCLVKSFLYKDRQFDEATSIGSLKLRVDKSLFLRFLRDEIWQGRIILNGFYSESEDAHFTSFIAAGETKEEVDAVLQKVKLLK